MSNHKCFSFSMLGHGPALRRRTWLTQALVLAGAPLTAMVAPAWAQATATAGGQRNRVTLGLTIEPNSLDPTTESSAAVGQVVHYNVLEGLTKIGEDGQVTPLLAQSWELLDGGRSCLLRLRRDARFHDGQPFDAESVRFSFARAVAPGATNKLRKTLFDNIAHLSTPDPHTVVLTLHRPDPHLLFRLGEGPAVVLHPASAGQVASQPVGTGPYQVQSWQRGQLIDMQRFSGFRDARYAPIGQARFRFMPNEQDQDAALREDVVDLFFQFATRTVQQLQGDPRYQVLLGSSGGKGLLALNHRRAPLGDVRVRRAINHAIDREGFIRHALNGRGSPIGSHFAPTDPGYLHLANLLPYDPPRARALLKEAGVPRPLRLQLALPPTPYARDGGPVLAQDLAQVGITVELHNLSWAQWLQGPFRGDFDLTLISHVEPLDYAIYADPDYYFGYDSAVFRALVHDHAQTANPRQRQQLFAAMQRHLAEDAANAWIFNPQIGALVRKGLRGVWMHYPIFAHDLGAMWWE